LSTEFTFKSVFASTLSGIVALAIIYKFHAIVSRLMGIIFHGESYNYRQRLVEFAGTLHNIFSLKEQGRELLSLLTRSVGCRNAALLFPGPNGDFEVQMVEPVGKNRENSLAKLVFKPDDPIVEYLKREQRSLTRESLALLPDFLGLWQQEKDIIKNSGIELFMPLISRDRLIGIIILDSKKNGRYNLEDHNLLEQVTKKVAVSMEKEYLWEQLQEREEELSVINRSNSIIASSLDIQKIYDNFINELKRIVEVDWAAIAVIERQDAKFIAISAETDSPWKINEKFPIKGTAIEWVAKHQRLMQESDLKEENHFVAGEGYLQHSVRSVVHLPLVISNRVIGALIVASRKAEAYSPRQLTLLEQLASQIAMPIENACLYAKTEHLARVDSLTGLLNRRSLDEILSNEIGRHSRYGGSFSLIILDLDLFKSFNDTFGHLAGDELLRQIGAIMKNTVREADQAFRYGGDEFAILLPQTPLDAALRVAERIRQQTFATVEIESKPISVSLGLASWPANGLSPEEVLASADAALYQAKKSGGNHTVCSQLDFRSPDRKNITGSLKDSQGTDDLNTIFALAATVDARDRFAHDHAKQVHNYATAMGRELGMKPQEIEHLGTCALLHDVGKIGISNDILQKSEALTESEWEIIKCHPALGAAIISHCSQLSSYVDPVLHHHEKFDGGGYPDGLKGEEIPLESRILSIADSFAMLTSEHVYSPALTYEVAIDEIKKGAGTQFDPKLVDVFLKIVPGIIVSPEETKIRIENN
ncbi:MAG: diguanylate cyclase, partial [Dehalococcoidales bacterium]|nr:diguanylate cyclase [Dehalococcoidales bacterium]